MELRKIYNRLNLKEEYFDNQSEVHGVNHTYRVMCLIIQLGKMLNLTHETKVALCAAFIHDMSRQHDGYCTEHGTWAVEQKLPQFIGLFSELGLADADVDLIKVAISNHSVKEELLQSEKAYNVTALLKDADALDRIRIGEKNLNTKFLRFNESKLLVDFAKELYYKTKYLKLDSLKQVLQIVDLISQKTLNYG
jgi:HD superfamily phosphodiesterase